MSAGANPTRSIGAGFASAVVAFVLALGAHAGTGPDADPSPPPPLVHREARPIGPAPALAPASGEPAAPASSGSGWFVRTALALGGVLVLILISGSLTRALARGRGGLAGAFGPGGRAPSGVLSVLGRYPVSRGQKLVLLQVDQRVLLISQSTGSRLSAGGGMATLCEITDPDEVASILIKTRDAESDSMSERFRSMLGAVDRAFRPHAEQSPDHGMRRVLAGPGGDHAEVWDDRAIASAEAAPTSFPVKQPGPQEHDAVGSLRRRLAALRSEDGALEAPA